MTQGFYEQLGVGPTASAEEIRAAYNGLVTRLARRLKQAREQHGDPGQLELARARLDEAFAVLSDPARRRRYDALLTWQEQDPGAHVDIEALWAEVRGALIHPGAAAAMQLLRQATGLDVGQIPGADAGPAPQQAPAQRELMEDPATLPTLAPATGVATSVPATLGPPAIRAPRPSIAPPTAPPTAPTEVPPSRGPQVVALPTAVPEPPRPDLKVVEGASSSVIVLPPEAPRHRTLTSEQVGALTDAHGYSGSLLRAVREAKGISLQEVADSTRISVRYLEAIENDAHDSLPSATFVRGYVREMSRVLKLDEQTVVSGYMQRLG